MTTTCFSHPSFTSRVVPVIVLSDEAQAVPLAHALLEGGIESIGQLFVTGLGHQLAMTPLLIHLAVDLAIPAGKGGRQTSICSLTEPVVTLQRQTEQKQHGSDDGGPVVQLAKLELQHHAQHCQRGDHLEGELGRLDHPIFRKHRSVE